MIVQKDKNVTPTQAKIRQSAMITVLCDILIMLALVVFLLTYFFRNNASNYDQNIDNISNIASASSRLIKAAIDNTSAEIHGAYNYCNGKTLKEILNYLSLVNGADSDYQLLKLDEFVSTDLHHVYSGYTTKKDELGNYQQLTYNDTALSTSLSSHASDQNGVVSYSQSFTNRTDALRYFSVFCKLSVYENDIYQHYYLIKPQRESKLLDQAQTITQYENLSVAICYSDGKYLARDNGYRGQNFFDYLYQYNDLSLDEKNKIRTSVQNNKAGAGVLSYHDYLKRECVFAYNTCDFDKNWYVILSIPTSEFITEKLFSFFPLTIILFLLILLVFNTSRLLVIVKELRLSVTRETIANAAKSSFLSRMSHEIRTPLNAIIGYHTIAQDEISNAKEDASHEQVERKVVDCLQKSDIASKHLLTIINDVLDMSAIEGGKIKISHEGFDFKELIHTLTTIFYSQARTNGVNFKLVFHTITDEWFVGDQMRVNQVLTNLLSNAIKFTAKGGSVVLKISQTNEDSMNARIHFEVSDTGIGMTEEYLSHIWTPFEQADTTISRQYGGSGLGLSITKNLVGLMNGNITVTSTLGVGTTFGVELTFDRTEQPATIGSYDFSAIHVLVVTDNDLNASDYISLLFRQNNVKCTAVTTRQEALQAIDFAKEHNNMYTICLVDYQTANIEFLETIQQIRNTADKNLPRIVLAAYDYSEIADQAAEFGVSQFIVKPLFQSSLFHLLVSSIESQPIEASVKPKTIDFHGANVILAEDIIMNMEIARALLKSAGINVHSAWNGKEAVELFEAAPAGTFMAILMDVHMPVMNGYAATRAIRTSNHLEAKTIPIIAMTADAFAENVAEAHAAGMNEHISKPIDVSILFSTLAKYL